MSNANEDLKFFEFSRKKFLFSKNDINLLSIDLVDACNLACVTCPRGRRELKNNRGQMELETFNGIIAKAAFLGFKLVQLFNWSDPFLCKGLYKYTRCVKEHGLECVLSSNLSYRSIKDLIPTLKNVDRLIISVSGFTQDTYKINHRGGNIENVKKNLLQISEALRQKEISTRVIIRYFNFPYSSKEFIAFKNFADANGLEIVLWHGEGNPLESQEDLANKDIHAAISSNTFKTPSFSACSIGFFSTVLDYRGDVYLCCMTRNTEYTQVGNFLSDDFDLLQYRRVDHPYCKNCRFKAQIRLDEDILKLLCHGMRLQYMVKSKNIEMIQGREVYFYGCGYVYRNNKNYFLGCKVKAILVDFDDGLVEIDGLPVKHPDEVLPFNNPLPIIVFAQPSAEKIIIEKLKNNYPQYAEIYSCWDFDR